ncbi:NUDIX domain-containing protein [Candidatus Woesearchaeota archaeon]|nr:NUDIX domain-containing protein [Candidatus Woesearchaeota archaeon]
MDHEFLSVVDGNDVVLGFSTREDIRRRGLNYRCVQVLLFNAKDELLLCRRPTHKKKFANQWAAVMGHVRRGESYAEAAVREVKEELGVTVKLSRVTKFSMLEGPCRIFQEIHSGYVTQQITPDQTEISEVKPIALKDLRTDMVMVPNKYAPPFVEAVRAYMKARNIY